MPKPSRSRVTQMELFRSPPKAPELPREVCQKTVQLLARMLREHARKAFASGGGRETGNE